MWFQMNINGLVILPTLVVRFMSLGYGFQDEQLVDSSRTLLAKTLGVERGTSGLFSHSSSRGFGH